MDDEKKKVVHIESAPKRKKEKVDKARLFHAIAQHMIDGKQYSFPFKEKYFVYLVSNKDFMVLKETSKGSVIEVGVNDVASTVAEWCADAKKHDKDLCLGPTDITRVVSLFLMLSPKLKEVPKPFAFSDYGGLTFHKLSFVPDETFDAFAVDHTSPENIARWPILDFLGRCSDGPALLAWIGGLFYDESYMQQYVYLTGEGDDGKGALVRLLAKIFGPAYHADDPGTAKGNRFWTRAFIGKRLVCFPDTNFSEFAMTGMMKSLTGGDAVRMETKGGATFTQDLQCKFMLVSNEMACISNDRANLRRCILITVDKYEKWSASYEKTIQEPEQIKFFVELCMAAYRNMCPDHSRVQIDYDKLREQMVDPNEEVESFFESNFIVSSTVAMPADTLYRMIRKEGMHDRRTTSWLKKSGFAHRQRVRTIPGDDATKVTYYLGIAPKGEGYELERSIWAENCRIYLPYRIPKR